MKSAWGSLICFVLVTAMLSGQALASTALQCAQVYSTRADIINRINSEPADIRFMDNPEFWGLLKARFEQQKSKDPSRPYGFAMPELSKTVHFMKLIIEERLSKFGTGHEILWREHDKKSLRIYQALGLKKFELNLYQNLRAERELLSSVLNDLNKVPSENPAYDDLLRLAYFTTRVMSLTAPKKQFWPHMFLDLAQETGIQDAMTELKNYKAGMLPFDTKPNFLSRHFVYGHRKELFDPENIQLAVLPVAGALTNKNFLEYRNLPIHLMSVIQGNLPADGWNMNEHQLGVHDYYFHGAQKYYVDLKFRKQYQVTDEQWAKLTEKQSQWFNDIWTKLSQEKDPKTRAAIQEMISYVLHDRPQAFFPDAFLKWNKIMVQAKIRHKIVGQLAYDGISDQLIENLVYNKKGVDWLHSYWTSSLITEDPLVKELRSQRLNEE